MKKPNFTNWSTSQCEAAANDLKNYIEILKQEIDHLERGDQRIAEICLSLNRMESLAGYFHRQGAKRQHETEPLTPSPQELKNAYMRQWRRRNPDRVKYHQQSYWLRRQLIYMVKERHAAGWSVAEIAVALQVTTEQVNDIINKAKR